MSDYKITIELLGSKKPFKRRMQKCDTPLKKI